MYVSFLGISGALHLAVFEQPVVQVFFTNLLRPSFPFILQKGDGIVRSSFPRRRESRLFDILWTPAFAGVTTKMPLILPV
jgi:hypothetical protein